MATDIDERPGVEELFASATNASALVFDVNRRTSLDVVIAAGMSRSRLGLALMQLSAEWDRTEKPRKATDAQIATRAAQLKDRKGRPDVRRAMAEAVSAHARAMRELSMKLRGRNAVMGMLTEWANLRGVDVDLLSPALFHFIAPGCGACDGRGFMRHPEAPTRGATCKHCDGAGTWPRPFGAQEVHELMKSCVGQVRGGMAARLRG
jgi:hypothetical protein